MSAFIGIDGGGTQTTALVTDAEGVELARVQGPPGIVSVLEPEAGARNMAKLAKAVLAQAGAGKKAAALCCALAGAGREPERRALEEAIEAMRVSAEVFVVGDFEAALQDAFGDGPGILVISGTGSSAWARDPFGMTARAGGWGHILGDEGSGYALGLAALRQAAREHDGREKDNTFITAVLEQTNLNSAEGLIRWAAAAAKKDIAALATVVFEAAKEGSRAAQDMIAESAQELALHVAAVYDRLGPWAEAPSVALAGGLLDPGRTLRPPVRDAIAALGIAASIHEERIDAARGAAALARLRARA